MLKSVEKSVPNTHLHNIIQNLNQSCYKNKFKVAQSNSSQQLYNPVTSNKCVM